MEAIIEHLVHSAEPTIRYKTRVDLLGEDPTLPDIQRLQQEIKRCARVLQLLSERQPDGTLPGREEALPGDESALERLFTVDWGGTSLKRMNLFVTVEALSLLKTSSAGGSLSSSAQAKS